MNAVVLVKLLKKNIKGLAQKTGECAAAATQLQYPGVAQVRRKRSQQIGALR